MGVRNLEVQCDNMANVFITKDLVRYSRPMMREFRLLKRELHRLGVHISSLWLPSALNKYADALSRMFPRGELLVRRSLRRCVMDGMQVTTDIFPYRPLGEHRFFFRMEELTRS